MVYDLETSIHRNWQRNTSARLHVIVHNRRQSSTVDSIFIPSVLIASILLDWRPLNLTFSIKVWSTSPAMTLYPFFVLFQQHYFTKSFLIRKKYKKSSLYYRCFSGQFNLGTYFQKLLCIYFVMVNDQINLFQMFWKLVSLKYAFRLFQSNQLTSKMSKEDVIMFCSNLPIRRILYW